MEEHFMKKQSIVYSIIIALVLCVFSAAQAHITQEELSDSNFNSPFILTQPADSNVVVGYLSWFDIDVYEFEVAPAMAGPNPIMIPLQVPVLDDDGRVIMDYTQFPPAPLMESVYDDYGAPVMAPLAASPFLINPSVSSPNFDEAHNFYVSVGLIGPGLPGHDADDEDGILMGFNRPVSGETRNIYTVGVDEMNGEIAETNAELGCNQEFLEEGEDLSMWLPHGLSQDCLHCNQGACDYSNVVSWYSIYAGTYKIYIFNTNWGLPGDYIFANGIQENGSTCDQIATTVDILQRAAVGELYHNNGTDAGNSGWVGCE